MPPGTDLLFPTYARKDVAFVRGRGVSLYDEAGAEYLDLLAGIAVASLGYGHPALVEAIRSQAGEIIHTSNLFRVPLQERLAGYLADLSFGDRVFFCNSGTEANECAFKTVRHFQRETGHPERVRILSLEGSFHGRTLGALSATGQAKYREGFGPLGGGFSILPFGDLSAVRSALDAGDVAGVIVEVIQAEGGVRLLPAGYLKELRSLCDHTGALLIFDEVQTGVGRTGTLWAHEAEGVTPDLMTLAKGLAGGVPIGACVSRSSIAEKMTPGTHASTFGGNPLACAASIAVLKTVLQDQLVERARAAGERIKKGLGEIAKERSSIKEIRGRGLLWGVELDVPAGPVVERLLRDHRVVAGVAGEQVLRLAPPLIIQNDAIDRGLEAIKKALA